jgi:hypothetical protein
MHAWRQPLTVTMRYTHVPYICTSKQPEVCLHLHGCTHIHTHGCVRAHTHTCLCTSTQTRGRTGTHAHICTRKSTCTCRHINRHPHTHMHTHADTCKSLVHKAKCAGRTASYQGPPVQLAFLARLHKGHLKHFSSHVLHASSVNKTEHQHKDRWEVTRVCLPSCRHVCIIDKCRSWSPPIP